MLQLIITFYIAIAFFNARHSGPFHNLNTTLFQDTLLVDRDGNRYPVKKMLGNYLWITANLNVNVPDSYCYGDVNENCKQYGRLYTWESAQNGCRLLGEGWRLPTDGEWLQLSRQFGYQDDSIDYRKKAYKDLLYGGSARFNAVLGGGRGADGKSERMDAHGFYWTATENNKRSAIFYNFGKGSQSLYRQEDGEKSEALSVRCVKQIDR